MQDDTGNAEPVKLPADSIRLADQKRAYPSGFQDMPMLYKKSQNVVKLDYTDAFWCGQYTIAV